MNKFNKKVGLMVAVVGALATDQALASSSCSDGKPIRFAEIGWDSGKFETEIIRNVLENGYGCKTEAVPGTNPITMSALISGKLEFWVEYWKGRTEIMEQAAKDGKIQIVGSLVKGGGIEGIYVPEYVVKGDPARNIKPLAPELKSVSDLPKYKEVFKDPEEPSKGRFLNCPTGWSCERDNNQRFKAYELDDTFNNFRPGTGAALDSAIASAAQKGQPLLFSYFEPSSILGKYKSIRLEEPAWTEECWRTINGSTTDNPCGSASPATELVTAVSTAYAKANPEIVEFVGRVQFPLQTVNEAIAEMAEKKIPADQMAKRFLKNNPDIWKAWVSESVAEKVQASLN